MADPPKPKLGDLLLYVWRLSRPDTWMVTILPMYIGWVLASRDLAPGLTHLTNLSAISASQGASTGAFAGALAGWLVEAWPLMLACVVMGPLVWAATLLINDVHDLEGDRRNPRKARSPLVQGLVTRGWANGAARGFAVAALAVAWPLGAEFIGLVGAALVLAWAYSVPPIRLKTRPGADVMVNAIGVGVLAALAGWTIVRPVAEFPFAFLPQGLLVAAAVYIPTTLVDREADAASGYLTLATHLGHHAAYRIGWWCWAFANAGAIALSWMDAILPRRMLPILVVFVPLLLYQYHKGIGRARDGPAMIEGIVGVSLTFLCVNLLFALMYTGLWV